jgi:hypothetical protein
MIHLLLSQLNNWAFCDNSRGKRNCSWRGYFEITAKMSLLSKRFQREIQYRSFFPKIIELEKVWTNLYAYRSLLAHGGNPDFKQKFLVLNSTDTIRLFLMETLKLLILYALKDPEFLADLQKC